MKSHGCPMPDYCNGEQVVDMHGKPVGEVRTTSASGGEKGVKPQRFGLLPGYALGVVGEHYAAGAEKYSDHNWRKGYEFSKSIDSLLRHAYAFADGEDNDPELGTPHPAAIVFHALTLIQGMRDWPQFDDRYKP